MVTHRWRQAAITAESASGPAVACIDRHSLLAPSDPHDSLFTLSCSARRAWPETAALYGMAAAQPDVSGAFQALQAACQGQLPLTSLAQQLEQ